MYQIVRRVSQTPAQRAPESDLEPPKTHRSGGIFVTSQVALGIEPKLVLSWSVQPPYWSNGYVLLVFHSASGFSPEKYPDDLNRHGQLIIETAFDASHELHPAEGTHFYTFVLYKKCFLGLSEKMSILRFSETIPSAKVAIGRIRNKLELDEMRRRYELSQIAHEADINEAEVRRIESRERLTSAQQGKRLGTGTDAIVAEELAAIDATVDALFAKHTKVEELKRDPRFKKLSRKERKEIRERIEERLDAGEISARREMRGT